MLTWMTVIFGIHEIYNNNIQSNGEFFKIHIPQLIEGLMLTVYICAQRMSVYVHRIRTVHTRARAHIYIYIYIYGGSILGAMLNYMELLCLVFPRSSCPCADCGSNRLGESKGPCADSMAFVDDDMMEGSVSSLILNSLESNQSGDVLSPEDVAWVDSCFIKDSEISDSNWKSLKDALLDIISSQPDLLDSSAAGGDDFSKNDTEILPYIVEEAETAQFLGETEQFLGETDNDLIPIYEEMEKSDDDSPKSQKSNTLLSQTYYKNAFLPNYNDDLKVGENIDLGLDLGLQGIEMEPLTDDIFMVWDLDISAEEDDELVKQLNKALAGSYSQSIPSTFEDSGAWKDMKDLSVDDLVAGIADLSLSQNSSREIFLC